MLFGYNTNGFAHHRWDDALRVIAGIGYKSVALTLDHDLLDPPERSAVEKCAGKLQPVLEETGLRITLETGARFILDPRCKHQPTLISAKESDRKRRIEFLLAAVDLAAALSADSVSLWSGKLNPDPDPVPEPDLYPDDESPNEYHDETLWGRLCDSLSEVLDYAAKRSVRIAFEPEPGMFIDTMARFGQLLERVNHPNLGLTLDVGHVHCLSDGDVGEHIRQHKDRLWNVHIEDMRRGVHEHLMFGEGEMDFELVFEGLRSIEYAGPVHVELSRHSHDAVRFARESFNFLQRYV